MNDEEITLQTIEKIKDFMFADLDKTIALSNSCNGAPNFMLALVLCCYAEFWGRLIVSPKGEDEDKRCFKTFFCKLGTNYKDLIVERDIYDHVRCGLVHEYSIKSVKGDDSVIKIEGGDCGIVYDKENQKYTFYTRKYLEDFKIAVDKYIEELRSDADKFNRAKQVLENKKIEVI